MTAKASADLLFRDLARPISLHHGIKFWSLTMGLIGLILGKMRIQKAFVAFFTLIYASGAFAQICDDPEPSKSPEQFGPVIGPAQPRNPIFQYKDHQIPDYLKNDLEILCWRFDEKTGTVLDGRGLPMTDDRYRELSDPFDLQREQLAPGEKQWLSDYGCRIDLTHVLCPAPDGEKIALNNAHVATMRRQRVLSQTMTVVDKIRSYLAARDPRAPMDERAFAEIQSIVHNVTGEKNFPPLLKSALSNRNLTSARLDASLQAVSNELQSFFDGKEKYKAIWDASKFVDVHTGEWMRPGARSYFDGADERFGRMAQQQAASILAETDSGRRLLAYFKNEKGELKLPAIRVGPSPGAAHYAPGANTMTFNDDEVLKTILRRADDSRRSEIKREISAPEGLTRWLLKHPDDLKAFIHDWDSTVLHELVHSWQDRRNPVGPFHASDVLEEEYEAHTWQQKLILERLISNPEDSLKNAEYLVRMGRFALFVSDYNRFRLDIAQQYQSLGGIQASDIPTVLDVINRAKSEAWARGLRDWKLLPTEALQVFGLRKTEQALKRAQCDYERRTQEFLTKEYPAMQAAAKTEFVPISERMIELSMREEIPFDSYLRLYSASRLIDAAKSAGAENTAGVIEKIQKISRERSAKALAAAARSNDRQILLASLNEALNFGSVPIDNSPVRVPPNILIGLANENVAAARAEKTLEQKQFLAYKAYTFASAAKSDALRNEASKIYSEASGKLAFNTVKQIGRNKTYVRQRRDLEQARKNAEISGDRLLLREIERLIDPGGAR